jgi:hypothetical protein
MSEANAFGIPEEVVAVNETAREKVARLKAKAEAQAANEFDEEAVYAKLLAEARAARMIAILPEDDTSLPVDTQGFPIDYDVVTIFRGQNKNDLAYVPISVNGFCIKVPRGDKVIIPNCFTQVLENAVEEITIQSEGGLITRPSHRFPYAVERKATAAEYAAFQAEQKSKAERQAVRA